jgi:hypothetical protein
MADVAALLKAAEEGDKEVCRLALHNGTAPKSMLPAAAKGGHYEICHWILIENFNCCLIHKHDLDAYCHCIPQLRRAIYQAARYGHLNICKLLLYWWKYGVETIDPCAYYEYVLLNAAYGGHADVCKFAMEIGARDFKSMLIAAEGYHHPDVADLAKTWLQQKAAGTIQPVNLANTLRCVKEELGL